MNTRLISNGKLVAGKQGPVNQAPKCRKVALSSNAFRELPGNVLNIQRTVWKRAMMLVAMAPVSLYQGAAKAVEIEEELNLQTNPQELFLLTLAPVFIYLLMRLTFRDMDEQLEEERENERQTRQQDKVPLRESMPKVRVRSLILPNRKPEMVYTSSLEDPELKDLATKFTQEVSRTVRDAKIYCQRKILKEGLHQGVPKVEDLKWIYDVLGIDAKQEEAGQLLRRLSEDEGHLVDNVAQLVAEQTAVKKIEELMETLEERRNHNRRWGFM